MDLFLKEEVCSLRGSPGFLTLTRVADRNWPEGSLASFDDLPALTFLGSGRSHYSDSCACHAHVVVAIYSTCSCT